MVAMMLTGFIDWTVRLMIIKKVSNAMAKVEGK